MCCAGTCMPYGYGGDACDLNPKGCPKAAAALGAMCDAAPIWPMRCAGGPKLGYMPP